MTGHGHMAVYSVSVGDASRSDFLIAKNGRGWIRTHRLDGSRTRWSTTSIAVPVPGGPTTYALVEEKHTVRGPVLIEASDTELLDVTAMLPGPPRSLGARCNRVLEQLPNQRWSIGEVHRWIGDWAYHRGISAEQRVHPRGRRREQRPKKAAAPAAPGGSGKLLPSTAGRAFEYPDIVDGRVVRPNGEQYRIRRAGRYSDVEVLRRMREHGIHTLSTGQPGTGKTAMMEAAFGSQLITVMGSEDIEAADLLGSYGEDPDTGRWRWLDGPLIIAMEKGWVIYIDEIGVIRQKQISTLYSVMDGRGRLRITQNPERGVIRAAPGFAVAASTNIDSAEVRMTDAAMNRFGYRVKVPTDYDMLRDEFGIPGWLAGAAANLEIRRRASEIPWAPQTRDLLLWQRNTEILGGDMKAELEALGSMVNGAPVEAQATVEQVLSKARGKKVEALVLA